MQTLPVEPLIATQATRDPDELVKHLVVKQNTDGRVVRVTGDAYRFEGPEGERRAFAWSVESELCENIGLIRGKVIGPPVNGAHEQVAMAALAEYCGAKLKQTFAYMNSGSLPCADGAVRISFYALVAQK